MTDNKTSKDKKIYRWCQKREQHVDLEVCRIQAAQKKYCCKCLNRYNQLPLFSPEMLASPKNKQAQ